MLRLLLPSLSGSGTFLVLFFLGAVVPTSQALSQTLVDTIKVGQRAAVVFSLSQLEVDSLEKDPNSGIDEVLDDFFYYFDGAEAILDSEHVEIRSSVAKTIVVVQEGRSKPFVYDRTKGNAGPGVIFLATPKQPQVILGVQEPEGWRKGIINYFSTKDQR